MYAIINLKFSKNPCLTHKNFNKFCLEYEIIPKLCSYQQIKKVLYSCYKIKKKIRFF